MSLRVLHVDAGQGASGDMILGALLDLGAPIETLRTELGKLALGEWSVESERVVRCALHVRRVDVHGKGSPARHWSQVQSLLAEPSLPLRVRERALAIFRRLFEAEAEVHGESLESVHLHEAGSTDAVVDIVGACVALEHLRVDRIVVTRMTTGFGEVHCSHGTYPVPAPATLLLTREAPVEGGRIAAERLTPTGAAILTTLADEWGGLPPMRPTAIGYGAGSRELPGVPNALRMTLGEASETTRPAGVRGEIVVLECTMDDELPQVVAHTAARLLERGALDVHTSAVTMKKGRLGHGLTVLARPEDAEDLARFVLEQTSTLGIRFRREDRIELERRVERVETPFGSIDVKVGHLEGREIQAWPEYEQCAERAREHGVALRDVQQSAIAAYRKRGTRD